MRSKNIHIIEVHYPQHDEGMIYLKKRIGNTYGQFIKNYILALPISDKEKNKLYTAVVDYLLDRKE